MSRNFMQYQHLQHLVYSIHALTNTTSIVIFGLPGLWCGYKQLSQMAGTKAKFEALDHVDVALLGCEDFDAGARIVKECLGKDTTFHHTFGYYADVPDPWATGQHPKWTNDVYRVNLSLQDYKKRDFGYHLEPHRVAIHALATDEDTTFVFDLLLTRIVTPKRLYECLESWNMGPEQLFLMRNRLKKLLQHFNDLESVADSARHDSAQLGQKAADGEPVGLTFSGNVVPISFARPKPAAQR